MQVTATQANSQKLKATGYPVGAATCRPQKRKAFFRYTPRICAVTIAVKPRS